MRHAAILIPLLAALIGCNRSEPSGQTRLPIHAEMLPAVAVIDADVSEAREKMKGWAGRIIQVNSADDLPDDPFGFTPAYSSLSYSTETLLLWYNAFPDFHLESTRQWFIRDNSDNTYRWNMDLGGSFSRTGKQVEKVTYVRMAIVVAKLPDMAEVSVAYGISDYSWDWEEAE